MIGSELLLTVSRASRVVIFSTRIIPLFDALIRGKTLPSQLLPNYIWGNLGIQGRISGSVRNTCHRFPAFSVLLCCNIPSAPGSEGGTGILEADLGDSGPFP